jgi:hypothetical protein
MDVKEEGVRGDMGAATSTRPWCACQPAHPVRPLGGPKQCFGCFCLALPILSNRLIRSSRVRTPVIKLKKKGHAAPFSLTGGEGGMARGTSCTAPYGSPSAMKIGNPADFIEPAD